MTTQVGAALGTRNVLDDPNDAVGVHGNGVDSHLDEEPRELWVVAWSLAAETDGSPGCVRSSHEFGDHPLHGRTSLVEQEAELLRVTAHTENELRQVVRTDGEAIEIFREHLRFDHVRRDLRHYPNLQIVVCAPKTMGLH